MSSNINISAYLQASQTNQSTIYSTVQSKNGTESSLTSLYESLDTSISIELSGSGSLLDTYSTDVDKVSAMKADLNRNIDSLRQMVLKLLDTQAGIGSVATGNLHKLVDKITAAGGIDQLSKSEAEALISDDGYWGVNQTSQRILDFAKALSGGNPDKISMLRDAFQKGFELAESLWGGELPEISYKTYDKVIKGFEEWSSGSA